MARSTGAASIRVICGTLLTTAAVATHSSLAFAADSSAQTPINDVHSLGAISLWDRAGHRVTSGSLRVPLNQEIARVTAPGPAPAGYRGADELNMWTPQDGTDPSQWNGGPLRAGAADLIPKDRQTAPLSTSNISDWTLQRDIVLCNGPSKGSYANLYQLRLVGIQEGPTFSPSYYTATIFVDTKAGTWKLLAAKSSGSSGLPVAPIGGAVGGGVLVALGGLLWRRRRVAAQSRRSQQPVVQPEPSLR